MGNRISNTIDTLRSRPSAGRQPEPARQRKQGRLSRLVSQWWARVLDGVKSGGLGSQEEMYSSHRTTRDFVWNTLGIGAWSIVFPILTVVIAQLAGAELAGMFALAYVTGKLMMMAANYGVRTFQVSDINEDHSFSDYQVNRLITCAIVVVAAIFYCSVRGYEGQMLLICYGVYLYKIIDGFADVYEGRLQQADKMYLAGISLAIRSVVVLVFFTVALLITGNVGIASIVMAVVAAVTLIVFTIPLALLETPKSRRVSTRGVLDLFKQCFPLFLALFLYTLIDNMPKFVMEGALSYDNQLYFNVLYFPAQCILLTVGLIYKPLLVRLANEWANPDRRKRFDIAFAAMILIIVAITAVVMLLMGWIGIPILSFLYGIDFEQFRSLAYVMLAAGAVTAAIDFVYQVITVLRMQHAVTKLYLITFGFSLFVPTLMINFTGLPGAVVGYLIVMSILFALLVMEYISIRVGLSRKEAEPVRVNAKGERPAEPIDLTERVVEVDSDDAPRERMNAELDREREVRAQKRKAVVQAARQRKSQLARLEASKRESSDLRGSRIHRRRK